MTSLKLPLTTEFDDAIRDTLRDSSWAGGVSLAITDRDTVLSQGTYGLADIAAQTPVESDTMFEIGSISKGFTAALILQARDSDLLELDAPVSRYLPWFEVKSEFDPITVRHLLHHTAGIVGGAEYTGDAAFEVWALRDTAATTPPGSWFYYSNTGYKALGLVVEAVYHQPYEQVLHERLLEPLGMVASDAAITHDTRRRLAVGYSPFYDDRTPSRADGLAPATWVETATADGSIASTAVDMTAWLRLLLGNGDGPGDARVLQPNSFQEMLHSSVESDATDQRYGLGLYVYEQDGRTHVAHGGGMVGYNAAIVCDRDRGLGAVVLANGVGPWSEVAEHAISWAAARRSDAEAPALVIPASAVAEPPATPSVIEEPPPEWAGIVGHYRGYNPWLSNIRVQYSGGRLWAWQGDFSTDLGDPLTPLPDGTFRVGEDERSPERLRFDVVLNGKAVRADLSGYSMYRTFTP